MKNSLKFFLSVFLLISILLLTLGFISAEPLCTVISSNNCNSPNVVLMRISGNTNAHGALESQSNFPTNQVVCCQDIAVGSRTCLDDDEDGIPENKIIGLSSSGNAHAERPEFDSQDYEDHVCYSSFSDVRGISDPDFVPGDYIPILSLSSETNAHIGSPSAYPRSPSLDHYVIYGLPSEGGGADECSLYDAYWEKGGLKVDETTNYVLSSISVGLVVEGNELCNGETIGFEITEDNTGDKGSEVPEGTFSEGIAESTWISQYMDLTDRPPRYFFTGEVSGGYSRDSGLLTVYDSDNSVDFCSEYTDYFEDNLEENEIICKYDPYEAALNIEGADCEDPDTTCSCIWDNDECKGAWGSETEGMCIIINQQCNEEECGEGGSGVMTCSWDVEWTGPLGTQPPECKADTKFVDCPAQIPLPFFGIYNFLFALLLVAAVYFVLNLRKQKKRK